MDGTYLDGKSHGNARIVRETGGEIVYDVSGTCVRNKLNGSGEQRFANVRIVGYFVDGLKSGPFEVYSIDPEMYLGVVCFKITKSDSGDFDSVLDKIFCLFIFLFVSYSQNILYISSLLEHLRNRVSHILILRIVF